MARTAGTSTALLVHGEAGIGKSTLLEGAVATARADGLGVALARGVESESDLPFAALHELCAPLLGLRDRLPDPQARALGGALALEPGGAQDRFAVATALLSLLATAAEDTPLLAVVDDLQWVDSASREAILFAARRLDTEGVVLLLGARDGAGAALDSVPLERLHLRGLDDTAARELLAGAVTGTLAPTVADELVATAGGNPLALRELPTLLSEGQRAGHEPLPARLPPGAGVERALGQRIAGLSDDAATAVLVAAAMQSGHLGTFNRALELLGVGPGAIEEAERAGVLQVDAREVGFRHPLLRSVAYHAAPGSRIRELHLRLADVATDPQRAVWHRAIAAVEPDAALADALEEQARDARTRGGSAAAARALTRAAELTTDTSVRTRRLLEAADDAMSAGGTASARALLDAAAPAADDPLAVPHARLTGRVLVRSGDAVAGVHVLREAADRVLGHDPAAAGVLVLEEAAVHMLAGDMDTLIATAREARALFGSAGADALRDVATLVLAEGLTARGRPDEARPLFAQLAPMLDGAPVDASTHELLGMAGQCLLWLGERSRSRAVLDRLVDEARRRVAPTLLIFPLAARADLAWRLGAWDRALVDAHESVRLARETDNASLLSHALATLARIEAGRGQVPDARRHAAEAIAGAHAAGADAVAVHGHFALGLAALTEGRPGEAADELARAGELADRGHNLDPHWVPWAGDLAEALVRNGERAEAERRVAVLAERGVATGSTWAAGVVARVRGLLEPDGDAALPLLEDALALLEQDGQPFEVARAQLALGERLRRERRRTEARDPLDRAAGTFEALGAGPWAQRARQELEATGRRARSRTDRAEADELTPGELQIALRVAEGMTNREVGAAVFVSPKTVEHHLTAIYRKLGVRSRTELARRLQDVAPALATG